MNINLIVNSMSEAERRRLYELTERRKQNKEFLVTQGEFPFGIDGWHEGNNRYIAWRRGQTGPLPYNAPSANIPKEISINGNIMDWQADFGYYQMRNPYQTPEEVKACKSAGRSVKSAPRAVAKSVPKRAPKVASKTAGKTALKRTEKTARRTAPKEIADIDLVEFDPDTDLAYLSADEYAICKSFDEALLSFQSGLGDAWQDPTELCEAKRRKLSQIATEDGVAPPQSPTSDGQCTAPPVVPPAVPPAVPYAAPPVSDVSGCGVDSEFLLPSPPQFPATTASDFSPAPAVTPFETLSSQFHQAEPLQAASHPPLPTPRLAPLPEPLLPATPPPLPALPPPAALPPAPQPTTLLAPLPVPLPKLPEPSYKFPPFNPFALPTQQPNLVTFSASQILPRPEPKPVLKPVLKPVHQVSPPSPSSPLSGLAARFSPVRSSSPEVPVPVPVSLTAPVLRKSSTPTHTPLLYRSPPPVQETQSAEHNWAPSSPPHAHQRHTHDHDSTSRSRGFGSAVPSPEAVRPPPPRFFTPAPLTAPLRSGSRVRVNQGMYQGCTGIVQEAGKAGRKTVPGQWNVKVEFGRENVKIMLSDEFLTAC